MRYPVDLHTHSTASDGQYPPAVLVAMAKQRGIEVLAVTDHDTIDGLDEALSAGAQAGITVLPGVEWGACEYRGLHILGYAFDRSAAPMQAMCREMAVSRNERKYRILRFLQEKGIELDLTEVETIAGNGVAGSGRIGRPHFAQAMMRHGYVSSMREAFTRYLDTDEYQRIERKKAPAQKCIAVVQESGGKAVLAHPYQVGLPDDQLEQLVRQLKEYGLEGIECEYPCHTPAQVRFYRELARRYDLHITAGSDFHGERIKPDVPLIPVALDVDWLLTEWNGRHRTES